MSYINKLNIILVRIQEPQLTDEEIETIKPTDTESLQEQYDILNTILESRGAVGNSLDKLKADAVSVANIEIDKPKKNFSNILIGFGLNG